MQARTLGILHIIYGSYTGIICIVGISIFMSFSPFIYEIIQEEKEIDAVIFFEVFESVIKTVLFLLLIFSAVPSILGGVALIYNKSWGMVLTLIAGCIAIFRFPFGTALGVYSLYVFLQQDKKNQNDKNKE